MKNKGISLIEILVYMALLSLLIITTFSMAFVIGRDKEHVQEVNERQTYTIAMFEFLRGQSEHTKQISTPRLGSTSVEIFFEDNFLKYSDGAYLSKNHKYILTPSNLLFNRDSIDFINISGNFILRPSVTLPFEILLNTWYLR